MAHHYQIRTDAAGVPLPWPDAKQRKGYKVDLIRPSVRDPRGRRRCVAVVPTVRAAEQIVAILNDFTGSTGELR